AFVQMRLQAQPVRKVEHGIVENRFLFQGKLLEQATPRLRRKCQAIPGHVGQPRLGLCRCMDQGVPVYPDVPLVRRNNPRDNAEQSGFSRAVFLAQRHASWRKRVSQSLEYEMVAIALAEIVYT